MSREPSYREEGAINVIYNLDFDAPVEDEVTEWVPSDPERSPSPGPSSYNLRPGRTYYGQAREQDDDSERRRSRRLARQQRKSTPYARAPLPPRPRIDQDILRRRGELPPEKDTDTAASAAGPHGRGAQAGEPDGSGVKQGADEEDDDGVVGPRDPLRIYKVPQAMCARAAPPRSPTPPPRQEFASRAKDKAWGSGVLVHDLPENGDEPQAPNELLNELEGLHHDYPGERIGVRYRDLEGGRIKWGFECLRCGDGRVISGSHPLVCVSNMRKHFEGNRHIPARIPNPRSDNIPSGSADDVSYVDAPVSATPRRAARTTAHDLCLAQQASTSGGSSASSAQRSGHGPDEVERFLCDVSLSPDLAGALRKVGIRDRKRIEMLGNMPDPLLDMLDKSLAEEGLDATERIFIRHGLRRAAAAAEERS